MSISSPVSLEQRIVQIPAVRLMRSLRRVLLVILCMAIAGGIAFSGVTAMTTEDAQKIAHGLIQGYIGPEHKVTDMGGFFGALVQALEAAHQAGWKDCASASSR